MTVRLAVWVVWYARRNVKANQGEAKSVYKTNIIVASPSVFLHTCITGLPPHGTRRPSRRQAETAKFLTFQGALGSINKYAFQRHHAPFRLLSTQVILHRSFSFSLLWKGRALVDLGDAAIRRSYPDAAVSIMGPSWLS